VLNHGFPPRYLARKCIYLIRNSHLVVPAHFNSDASCLHLSRLAQSLLLVTKIDITLHYPRLTQDLWTILTNRKDAINKFGNQEHALTHDTKRQKKILAKKKID
jgi:hypothetical protein